MQISNLKRDDLILFPGFPRTNVEGGLTDTFEVMGIEPRYRLRSGFAGMQLSSETRDTMSKFLKAVGSPYTRRENWKRTKIKKRHDEVSQENLLMFFDTILDTVRKAKEKAVRASWKCITGSDLECILCSRCLMEPVTTGCGHTFCRDCLTRVLDYGLSCPLCKSQLTVSDYARGYTMALGRAITFLARKEFDERISVTLEEGIVFGKNSDIPVFVCTTAFPNVACPLYVYEPRYRLMVRRCLHSPTKLFAMAAKDSNGFSSYGTVLKIKDAVTLNDGRFILTTVGLRRFKVLSRSEQDGYDTAKVQYIQDSAVSADKLQELIGLHCKVYGKATKWISSLKPKVMSEVERLIGQMPPIEANWTSLPDGPSWTWWLMPLLPLSSKLQIGFLSTTSLDKRLRAIDKMLEHMKGRMNGYERNPNCYEASDVAPSESCQYVLPFHVQ
ncbi:LON peptidase N-terminal domain and RING finger protein 3 isoform X2 [Aethina tumida]|uniref:LON peptidase N-terminal domain and RING finger protein 3 isoform X2 n=1 Tax=Aethina tumida TaxID=116153 RepID=UPI0021496692|nr:LON peptidase N-terminal domain and RING finger protein 3 isoform X2 [Aethina tumida]